ncbi:extensin-like [Amaranthus tricolor]|uniref:extensin-like n=1 Tax=Amaranthus tricolor TaxID=29722 RepID=UPI00258AD0DF|nr:extensin-like [Amaranthus tricolor]
MKTPKSRSGKKAPTSHQTIQPTPLNIVHPSPLLKDAPLPSPPQETSDNIRPKRKSFTPKKTIPEPTSYEPPSLKPTTSPPPSPIQSTPPPFQSHTSPDVGCTNYDSVPAASLDSMESRLGAKLDTVEVQTEFVDEEETAP